MRHRPRRPHVGLAFAMLLATLPLLASSLVLPSSPRCRPARMAIDLPAPPANPPTTCSDGGGDGDSLVLTTIDSSERQAVLTLWQWQAEMHDGSQASRASRASQYTPFDRDAEFLRSMITWEGEATNAGPFSRLAGRAFAANLGEERVAVVLVRYELDKSSLQDALLGKHVMVVDATAFNPSLASLDAQQRSLIDAGVNRALMELAQCHSMYIVFKPLNNYA